MDRRFEELILALQPVLEQLVAVIGGENDDRIPRRAGALQLVQDQTHLPVHHGDAAVIAAVDPLQLGAVDRVFGPAPEDQRLQRLRQGFNLLQVDLRRQGNFHPAVHRVEGRVHGVRRVRLEEGRVQEKRLVRRAKVTQELSRLFAGPGGGRVAIVDLGAERIRSGGSILRGRIVGNGGFRIVSISPLDVIRVVVQAGVAVVELDHVEAGGAGMRGGGRRKMQLADRAGAIARIAQPLLQQRLARVARCVVDTVAVAVRIASGEETDAGWNADRGLHEGVGEIGRLRGEPVQIWSPDETVAVCAKAVIAKLVGHDEQNVGLGGGGRGHGAAELQETSPGEIGHGGNDCTGLWGQPDRLPF